MFGDATFASFGSVQKVSAMCWKSRGAKEEPFTIKGPGMCLEEQGVSCVSDHAICAFATDSSEYFNCVA